MNDHDTASRARERKRALRAEVRARRAATDPVERAASGSSWTTQVLELNAVKSATVVAAYESYGTEPPTSDLIAALQQRGIRVLLPLLLEDRDLDWTCEGEVLGRDALASADVVVLPALLASTEGSRLGQGGGSYDRALARVTPGTPLIALVHDDEVLAANQVPREPHDRPVTHIVTPTRTLIVEPIDPDLTSTQRWDVALAVAAGGAIGSLARWGLNEAAPHSSAGFPWATFIENSLGCLLLGILMVFLLDVWRPTRYARPFLAVGVLGGFTTFSAYTVDTRVLLADGQGVLALTYLFGTLAVGVTATWVGLASGRAMAGVPQRRLPPTRRRHDETDER